MITVGIDHAHGDMLEVQRLLGASPTTRALLPGFPAMPPPESATFPPLQAAE